MFPRNPLASGQNTAQVGVCAEFVFACCGCAPHVLCRVTRPQMRALHIPCDPSTDFAPGLLQAGRLFPCSRSCDRQDFAGPARARRSCFRLPVDALEKAHRTSPTGGRACVFPPSFSLVHLPSQRRAVCSRTAMVSPACCKRRAAARLPARLSAQPLLMRLTKTWLPAQPLARLPVGLPATSRAPTAADRGAAADLIAATAAAEPVIRAGRGNTPAGLFYCSARRPACC